MKVRERVKAGGREGGRAKRDEARGKEGERKREEGRAKEGQREESKRREGE